MNETNVVHTSHENERLLCVRRRRIYVRTREDALPRKPRGTFRASQDGWAMLHAPEWRLASTVSRLPYIHGSHELSINLFPRNWFPRHLLYLNVIKGETVRTLTEESCSQFSRGRLSRRGATAELLRRCDSRATKISYHYLNKLSSFPRVKNRSSSVLLEISRCQGLVLRFFRTYSGSLNRFPWISPHNVSL